MEALPCSGVVLESEASETMLNVNRRQKGVLNYMG